MSVHVARDGPVTDRHHRPARGAQRRRRADRRGAGRRVPRLRGRRRRPRSPCSPAPAGTFCAGADLKAVGHRAGNRVDAGRRRPDGPDPDAADQAGDRRDRGLRRGRRPRAGAVGRPAGGRRGRRPRRLLPPLGRAADRRRHRAAAAADRAVARDGPDPDRPPGRGRGGATRSGWSTGSCAPGAALDGGRAPGHGAGGAARRRACGRTGSACWSSGASTRTTALAVRAGPRPGLAGVPTPWRAPPGSPRERGGTARQPTSSRSRRARRDGSRRDARLPVGRTRSLEATSEVAGGTTLRSVSRGRCAERE